MANFFRSIFDSLKLEDDDDEGYEGYMNELEEKERKKVERVEKESIQPRFRSIRDDDDFMESKMESRMESRMEAKAESKRSSAAASASEERKSQRILERPAQSKLVPLRSSVSREFEVIIFKPTSFADCQEITDMLLNGKASVINLEGFDDEVAQRVMDFVSGSIYAINGKLHQISTRIFIVSPDHIDITGDYLELVKQNGVDAPTIKRKF